MPTSRQPEALTLDPLLAEGGIAVQIPGCSRSSGILFLSVPYATLAWTKASVIWIWRVVDDMTPHLGSEYGNDISTGDTV